MGEFASKGLALGVGIPALALAGINTLREGGLGNLFGGGNMPAYETKEAAMLRSENAILKSDKYTDEKILAAYTAGQNELKERDVAIRDLVVEATKNACNVANLTSDVADLKNVTAAQNVELVNLRTRDAIVGEKLTCLANSVNDRFANQDKEFYAAINLEAERRACGDQNVLATVYQKNYIPGEVVMPASKICPSVVTCPDVVNYYTAGNVAPTPAATGGKGCSRRAAEC